MPLLPQVLLERQTRPGEAEIAAMEAEIEWARELFAAWPPEPERLRGAIRERLYRVTLVVLNEAKLNNIRLPAIHVVEDPTQAVILVGDASLGFVHDGERWGCREAGGAFESAPDGAELLDWASARARDFIARELTRDRPRPS